MENINEDINELLLTYTTVSPNLAFVALTGYFLL